MHELPVFMLRLTYIKDLEKCSFCIHNLQIQGIRFI